MELVLIRLTPPKAGARHAVGPELAVDLLWAGAVPGDRLEHIRARPGPHPPEVDLALFHRAEPESEPVEALSLGLCRRAIDRSPALAGWSAGLLPGPPVVPFTAGPADVQRDTPYEP